MRTIALLAALIPALGQDPPYQDAFTLDKADFASSGRNPYFILEPGHQLVLEDPVRKEVLVVTVLEDVKIIDGVETRVVEERETVDGQLKEVSRNFFAIDRRTKDLYYFGEDVDDYKDGKVVGHGGAWIHGEKGARFGLFLPGAPAVGQRYYQEIAPGLAMDRAEVVSVSETYTTPAGTFEKVLKTLETSALEADERSTKHYAPGVGLLQDGRLKLVRHGKT